MASRSNDPRCDHCSGRGKLRPSRRDPSNMLCQKCWNRFGGRGSVANPATGRRRSQRTPA